MGLVNGGLINVGPHGSQTGNQLALSDGLACFTGSFSGVITTQIGHNLNSTDLVVEFVDATNNLLIPDNWSIVNPNVIEVDFSPAATGRVTILACITSGLAPITGGVTILEGLSGIIDLDSPNGSIDISTSGQVINLNAIFTPASGAVLQQKCEDIITLSGLIGTGGGADAGQTSINGLSGVLSIISPDNTILIGDSPQAIELSGLFTQASGAVLQQKCEDIITLSGLIGVGGSGSPVDSRPATGVIAPDADCTLDLGAELARWRALYACSGLFRDSIGIGTSEPEFGIHVSGTSVRIEETATASGSASLSIATNSDGLGNVSAIAIAYDAGTKTSGINATTLINIDRSETTGGLVAGVGVLANSGTALAYGLITGADVNPVIQISATQELPTTILVDGVNETADLTTQGIETNVFVDDNDTLIIGHTQLFNEIDFEITVGAENNSILPVFEFSLGVGIWEEFQPLDTTDGFQQAGSLVWQASDVPGWSIESSSEFRIRITRERNNLKQSPIIETINIQSSVTVYQWTKDGIVTICRLGVNRLSPLEAIDVGGNIRAAGHLRSDGDCLYDIGTTSNKWAAVHACSGIFSDRLIIGGSGVALVGEGVQSVEGLSGVIDLDSPDGTVIIGTNGQAIELTVLPDAGQTAVEGLSGVIDLDSPDNSVDINVVGQTIELSVNTSGACSVHDFSQADGTVFAVTHGLNTEDFVWSMWRVDGSPLDTSLFPANIAPSGLNHAIVEFNTPIDGKLVIQGCSSSGVRADIIATRTQTDHYIASFIDSAIFVDALLQAVTITLPSASGHDGHSFYVKKIDSNTSNPVTVNGNGSGLIDDDVTTDIIAQYDALRITANDGNWWIL